MTVFMDTFSVQQNALEDFCHRYRVERLALFGSVLREDFRPDSDIDILVKFEPEAKIGLLTLGRMQRELSAMVKRKVDLVPQDGLKPAIKENVLASAHEVYAI